VKREEKQKKEEN